MTKCLLKQGIFGRWFVVSAVDENLGWSGSRWVPVSDEGIPTGGVQISNFETREDAKEYAEYFDLTVVDGGRG